jgi:hypothetical protein
MQTPATEIDQRIVQLNEFVFPSLPIWRLSRRIRQDLLLAASMMHSSRGFWTCQGYLRLEQRSPEWDAILRLFYSSRRATTGSTDEARRAGKYPAAIPAISRRVVAANRLNGSVPLSP